MHERDWPEQGLIHQPAKQSADVEFTTDRLKMSSEDVRMTCAIIGKEFLREIEIFGSAETSRPAK
jgi:hypothetical protein